MNVLVTRPASLSESLVTKLSTAGFTPECFPVIEFKPSSKQKLLSTAIQNLIQTDIAIFASQTAVQYGIPAIVQHFMPETHTQVLSHLVCAAMGPSTQKALNSFGFKDVLCPLNSPYESESLLALPALQRVKNKNIVIFRGNGGRELLAKTLENRGANLRVIECYERQIPTLSEEEIAKRLNAWSESPRKVIVSTSRDILFNLKTLVGPKTWKILQKEVMIVVGLRMQGLAANLGVKRIVVTKDADDSSLIEALMNIRNSLS